jgi:hypothetical protein
MEARAEQIVVEIRAECLLARLAVKDCANWALAARKKILKYPELDPFMEDERCSAASFCKGLKARWDVGSGSGRE